MYESVTFESILKRMLEKIPDDMDKREGSIVYDALAPCAIELQLMYIELDNILKETFADTSSREYLILRAKERGLSPYEASYAVLQGEFNIDVPLGTRFNIDEMDFVVTEKIEDCIYKLECETIGSDGNKYFGDMIPINYINGLTSAKLTKLLIPGEDEEKTESLRNRYFDSFDTKSYGGNKSDYLEKTNAIEGVGVTKVVPVWNGGGTVKLTILDSEYNKASDVLVETVQGIIDPTKDGQGVGVAPIGHVVTVDTVNEVEVLIETTLTFDSGYSFETLESKISDVIDEYILEERENWGEQSHLVIRIAYIEARVLSLTGILDISNTKINGADENLTLGEFEIPVLGGVTSV